MIEQSDIKNLQGRSVVLDALCEDDSKKKYNIEVQKSDNDDHQKRIRYNASCITANFAKTGTDFVNIPDVIIVFISRFDIFNQGRTVYHVDRVIRETGKTVENGLTEIHVNAAVKDGSDVSVLMDIFVETDAYDFHKFPKVSARKEQFKKTEKGAEGMCTLVEEYANEVKLQQMVKDIEHCSQSFNVTIEKACEALNIAVSDYHAAKKFLAEHTEN